MKTLLALLASLVSIPAFAQADPPDIRALKNHEPILLRMEAPVGRVASYRAQTNSWLPGFPTDSATPSSVLTDLVTESIIAVEGDVRTIRTVVGYSELDMTKSSSLDVMKDKSNGMTTVRRMDSRGRVLSTKVTKVAKGMDGPSASHAVSTFTLPEGPVRIGDTWTATETMQAGPGTGGDSATMRVNYRLERIDVKGDVSVAVISMNGEIISWFQFGRRTGPSPGTMTGEVQLDLSAKWIVGLMMSMQHGRLKTRMTTTAQ